MKLQYTGYDIGGKSVTGTLEAAGAAEATDQLRRQGIFTTKVTQSTADRGRPRTTPLMTRRSARRAKPAELVGFFRQLAILVSTRSPLLQALDAIERQSQAGAWREVIADLRRRVEEGSTLAAAMDAHAIHFDPICRSMVSAGESGGSMDLMLRALADLTRRQYHIRRSIIGALAYPSVLIMVSLAVLVITLLFVLPQFQSLFDTLNAPLPPTTQALVTLSNAMKTYWWAFIAGAAGLVVLATWSLRAPKVRDRIDHALITAPRLGPIFRSFSTSRIARNLGVLLEAKIPMLDAIRLTRDGASNACYAKLLESAEGAVSRGESLADMLTQSGLVVPSICEALSSGERAGQLGHVLIQVADFLDEDNEVLVRSLMSILEPVILTVLGLVIGFVAVSLFLPLFDLTSLGGGGA